MNDLFGGLVETDTDWPVEIVMHGEPSGKGRAKFSGRVVDGKVIGRAYTPEKTRNFEENLAWAAQVAMRGRPLFDGPLEVEVWAHMSIPASKPKKFSAAALLGLIFPTKKPDVDNFAKSALDSCNKVVFVDDAQVVDLHVYKRFSDQPRLHVRIREKVVGGC